MAAPLCPALYCTALHCTAWPPMTMPASHAFALGRYLRFRDPCLVSMLACMALYMVSTGNHQRWVDPDFATHPMFQVGGWVGGHGLAGGRG